MTKPIRAYGFNGMANVRATPAYLLDDAKRLTPHIVLNADVQDDGRVLRRRGHRNIINLPGLHSLWAGSVMLGVAPGENDIPTLYRFEGYRAQAISSVNGPLSASMEYVEVNRKVYLSNGYWADVYDLATDSMCSWGLPIPPIPSISLTEGNLPPGVYKLCYTYFEEPDRLSGNGPLIEVAWDGGSRGIELVGKPSNVLCWITQPNGKELFLANVVNEVIFEPYYTQPLASFGVEAPPALRALSLAHGRLWGAVGGKLHYSEEFQYEWFRPSGYLPFPEDIVMTVPINKGLFVNSEKTTWVLSGTTPDKMTVEKVGIGAIIGTLTYVLVEGGGYELSRRFSRMPTPVWATTKGIVAGTQTGNLVHLTEGRVRINPRSRGAAFYRNEDGQPVALFTLGGPAKGSMDSETKEINSRGRLYIPAPIKLDLAGGIMVGGEGEYS